MNTHIKNHVRLLIVVAVAAFTANVTFGDDLNPPPYRGGPLSVYAHWQLLPGTTFLDLTAFNAVDDADPSTTLHPLQVPIQVIPNNHQYQFQLPNWIDKEPIKYLRLQLTWSGTPQGPQNINFQAVEGVNPVPWSLTYSSPVFPDSAGVGSYQYYDIEFIPNPDFERFSVLLPPDGYLTQVVVDTISTIPEPATLSLLALGSLALFRKQK